VFSVALVSCGNKQTSENDCPVVEEGAAVVEEVVTNDTDTNNAPAAEVAEGAAVVEEAPAEAAPAEAEAGK
ncbi:MAG: hypothetical protein K2H38_06960, partial [Muribaculaceae bacterium]|nr:hypothetical protein [Muribaculaceae bacterium]